MLISYEQFQEILTKSIKDGDDFYLSLLETIIKEPTRYCGLFRLSNAKTKLIQNVMQSREIKFGDIIEELTTQYLHLMGYQNLNKNIGALPDGDILNLDQHFTDGSTIYIVEMKIRDDHDSTKKRGQYQNFHNKILLTRKNNIDKHINASMWFVDDGLKKNKNYYDSEMKKEKFENCTINLYYGREFFDSLKNGSVIWEELINILTNYRKLNASETIEIPDFGTSKRILNALVNLKESLWKKLTSDDPKYTLLRNEIFNNGDNIAKAKTIREEKHEKF